LALLLLGCILVMRPFMSALMWAAILAFTLWPIQRRLVTCLKGRRTLAAALMTGAISLVLVLPFLIIGLNLAGDVRALGTAVEKWVDKGPPAAPPWVEKLPLVGKQAKGLWMDFTNETAQVVALLRSEEGPGITNAPPVPPSAAALEAGNAQPAGEQQGIGQSRLAQALKRAISSTKSTLLAASLAVGRGLMEVALSVFMTFFLLRDGGVIADRVSAGLGRIAGDRGGHLMVVAGNTVRGVVYGILGTALAQGVAAGVGFAIAGVPGAALLGLLTFFLSVVPAGPPLLWIPAAIWLYSQGGTGWCVFMVIWGVGVSSLDNVVKPWLISQGSNMPFMLIFCGVLGGALAFGVIGVFLGPTLLAVAYRLIDEWSHAPAEPAPGAAPANLPPPPSQAD
jgi:predicted PurR-regulated permease PerM